MLGGIVDPLGKVKDSISSLLFPDEGVILPHEGVYAVIALSGSPFGDTTEYDTVKNSKWQSVLWSEALSINIIAGAIDTFGVGTAFASAATGADIDISIFLEAEFALLKTEITNNTDHTKTFIIEKLTDVIMHMFDFLSPYIHSGISNLQSAGLKKFFHIAVNTAKSAVDVWSGTISTSTRIGNYIFSVTPRESGYAVLGTFSGQTDIGPPSIPTGLTASAVSTTQINLSWTASTDDVGVVGYKVYRDGSQIGTSSSVSYSDTSLSPSTTYCYTVSAYDAVGNESLQSLTVCATTLALPDTTAPSIPTGITATASSSSEITLSWTASTDDVGMAGYKIYKDGVFLKEVSTTSTSDTGLSPSTTYCYTVSAYDAAGNQSGQSSPPVCATTKSAVATTWAKTYGGASTDYASSVQQTFDGGFIIAGETWSYGAGNVDVYLIKTDSNGNKVWEKTYGGASYDYASSVQQTTDGGYIIAGYTESYGAGSMDVYLIKTDSNGNVQ